MLGDISVIDVASVDIHKVLERRGFIASRLSEAVARAARGFTINRSAFSAPCRTHGLDGLMIDIGPGPVGADTAIFIYFIEEHPPVSAGD